MRNRKLYIFIKYLYFNTHVQDVADEFSFSRQLIYYHSRSILAAYDSDPDFKDKLGILFLPETMDLMRKKLGNKGRNNNEY